MLAQRAGIAAARFLLWNDEECVAHSAKVKPERLLGWSTRSLWPADESQKPCQRVSVRHNVNAVEGQAGIGSLESAEGWLVGVLRL